MKRKERVPAKSNWIIELGDALQLLIKILFIQLYRSMYKNKVISQNRLCETLCISICMSTIRLSRIVPVSDQILWDYPISSYGQRH